VVTIILMDELTDKQKRFVEEYLKDLNATQAAIRAGYSANTANEQGARLLANVSVKAAVAKGQEKLSKRAQIDQEWVLKNIIKVYKRCMQKTRVKDREGNFIGEFQFKDGSALKSLELLGKHLGMFAERVKLSNDDDKPFTARVTHAVDERIAQMLSEKE
jgi:phage terminase small subunit